MEYQVRVRRVLEPAGLATSARAGSAKRWAAEKKIQEPEPMEIKILTNKGEKRVKLPTAWPEVTADLYARLYGKSGIPLIAEILEFEPETVEALPREVFNMIAGAVSFLDSEVPQIMPEQFEALNVGTCTVGQLEKANEFVNNYPVWDAAPYLYAIYETPEYVEAKAFARAQELFELPIQTIYAGALKVLEQMDEFYKKYLPLISKEPDENELAAGIDRFAKFGFFATLAAKCNGDPLKYDAMLKVQADVFYMTLYFEHEQTEYQTALANIKRIPGQTE